jgi:hypothetical protein
MVGPRERKWTVLRETDGERFVTRKKFAVFKEIPRPYTNEKRDNEICRTIEKSLHAI